ncbi:MAG: hypothetical protein LBT05_07815 [Planctomycetaceae bacterium]|nr:hypothetical protein [Planctomycetaceae bacterium]
MSKKIMQRFVFFAVIGCAMVTCLGSVGCQTTRNGQTLPASTYLKDDVQFFSAGSESPLSQETQQMERQEAEYIKANQSRF